MNKHEVCRKCSREISLVDETKVLLAKIGVVIGQGPMRANIGGQVAMGKNDINFLLMRCSPADSRRYRDIMASQAHACQKCKNLFCGECAGELPATSPETVNLSVRKCPTCGGYLNDGFLKTWPEEAANKGVVEKDGSKEVKMASIERPLSLAEPSSGGITLRKQRLLRAFEQLGAGPQGFDMLMWRLANATLDGESAEVVLDFLCHRVLKHEVPRERARPLLMDGVDELHCSPEYFKPEFTDLGRYEK